MRALHEFPATCRVAVTHALHPRPIPKRAAAAGVQEHHTSGGRWCRRPKATGRERPEVSARGRERPEAIGGDRRRRQRKRLAFLFRAIKTRMHAASCTRRLPPISTEAAGLKSLPTTPPPLHGQRRRGTGGGEEAQHRREGSGPRRTTTDHHTQRRQRSQRAENQKRPRRAACDLECEGKIQQWRTQTQTKLALSCEV